MRALFPVSSVSAERRAFPYLFERRGALKVIFMLDEYVTVSCMEPVISAPEPRRSPPISGSNVSLKLLAAALILVFLYYAAGVVITLLLSILIAYFLDPVVELLERLRMPRTIAAMITVLV